jgi:hypothetical protein
MGHQQNVTPPNHTENIFLAVVFLNGLAIFTNKQAADFSEIRNLLINIVN